MKRDTVATTRAAFDDWFGKRPRCRVVLEASGQSRRSSRFLLELGFDVLVANPRRLPEVYRRHARTIRSTPNAWRASDGSRPSSSGK